MSATSFIPKSSESNYRIISAGLFQPVVNLNLTRTCPNTVTGMANLTIRELGRELNIDFKISGSYSDIPNTNRVRVNLKGYPFKNQTTAHMLFLEMEMDKDWKTGIATYQYLNGTDKVIRNATVSSILFTTMLSSGKSLRI